MDVYGLIGRPVEHSLSPPMHEAAYEELGLDARYVTFEPTADAGSAIAAAESLGMAGLNVTVPFKEAVVHDVTLAGHAREIEAVNTVVFTDDGAVGYNTDAVGFRRALAHHGITSTDRRAVLVGAGGAGRAIATALADDGAAIEIYNRTSERAADLAAAVGADQWGGLTEATLTDACRRGDLLINATSVGLEEDRSPVPAAALSEDLVVFDAVYRPPQTRLLREAAAVGARTIDGAWMLLYQGAAAFEHWTGIDAPTEAMNAALRDRLSG